MAGAAVVELAAAAVAAMAAKVERVLAPRASLEAKWEAASVVAVASKVAA